MNFELLEKIHQIHQDLADGKEGDTVELLKLVEKRKVNLDLLKDIHELYYNGYLHLPTYCGVFGYPKVDPITKHFKNNHLKTLGHKLTHQLYGDQIREKVKHTNLERYGVSNVSQSSGIREKVKHTNLERYGTTCSLKSPKIKEKIKQTNLERYGCESPLQSPEILEKMKQTCLERYGVPYASQSFEIREKVKRTNLERYGVECSFNSPEIREKVKRTNLERYGYENHLQSPGIKDKIRQTNLQRYGVEYALQSPEIREKMSQTCLERYGVPNASQSPVIRDKRSQTCLERYGVPNASQSPEIQEKMKQTCLERYGTVSPSQSPEIQEKIRKTNLERYGCEYPTQNPSVKEKSKQTRILRDPRYAKLEELVGSDSSKASQFVMGNYPYNHAAILRRYGLYQENLSAIEIAIREILEKHKIEYLFRHRPKFLEGKELDFFIPASNNPDTGKPVAIEVNGLYWHSTKFRDKFYHQDKHLRCRSEGIQLLSFTEDQILEKLEIIESMILHKLGKTPYRLYAKKCDIREIKTQEAKDFLENNHLHGFSNASVYLGLEYQGKLVHVMSFGNNRFKRSNHPELIRSASLRFHSVAGGFQRLLKYYKRTYNIDLVESYVDFNISNGNSYELASNDIKDVTDGDNLTEPDLWFVFRGKRYRRQMFMKHNLHKIFSDFPRRSEDGYEKITCGEFLRDRGVLEYYGAGNLKYLI